MSMIWALIALGGALFDAIHAFINKKILKNLSEVVVGAGVFLFTGIILLIISLFRGLPELGKSFFIAAPITAVINVFLALIFYYVLKRIDLSYAMPMQAFSPIFVTILAFFLLGELPTLLGIIGIFLVAIGLYVLHVSKLKDGFLQPLKAIVKNKYVGLMLLLAFIMSISATVDKIVVLNSDPFFAGAFVFTVAGLILFIIMLLRKENVMQLFQNYDKFLLSGSALAVSMILIHFAFTMQLASYVISVKRLSIVFAVLFGILFLKEKSSISRFIAALIMVIGIIFMII